MGNGGDINDSRASRWDLLHWGLCTSCAEDCGSFRNRALPSHWIGRRCEETRALTRDRGCVPIGVFNRLSGASERHVARGERFSSFSFFVVVAFSVSSFVLADTSPLDRKGQPPSLFSVST
jgi:hypothetical protein